MRNRRIGSLLWQSLVFNQYQGLTQVLEKL